MPVEPIVKAGDKAPEFNLKSTPDQKVTLTDFSGHLLVLLFYPADFSPVCGDELSIFSQAKPLFDKFKAQVVGISVDSVWCHLAFIKEKNLHIPLLADFHPKGEISKKYGAYSKKEGTARRVIVLIDDKRIIRWYYKAPVGVTPGVNEILAEVEKAAKDNSQHAS